MLETPANYQLLGTAPMTAVTNAAESLPIGEENGDFSSLFGTILKEVNVLSSELLANEAPLTGLPGGAILPPSDALLAESLPADGNTLPPALLAEQALLQEAAALAGPVDPHIAATQSMINGTAASGETQLAATRRGVLLAKGLLSAADLAGGRPMATGMGDGALSLPTAAATVAAQASGGGEHTSFLENLGQRLQPLSSQSDVGLPMQSKFAKSMTDLLNNKASGAQGNGAFVHLISMLDKPAMMPHTTPSVAQATIYTPVGQPGWDQELSSRVTWLMKQNMPSAEIKLTPANLGPIEVKIAVNNDQATVTMTAVHALTRDALEQAIPRLREMLADAGLQLANANVFSQSQQGGQGGRHAFDHAPVQQSATDPTGQEDAQAAATSTVSLSINGVVDLFA